MMKKSISVFAALFALSACAGDGERTSHAHTAADGETHLAVTWGTDGYGDGFIVKPVPSTTGKFRLRLNYRDPFSTSSTSALNRCFGHWDTILTEGDSVPQGTGGYWQVSCTGGQSAEGVLAFDSAGNGGGDGFDKQGQSVRLFFGTKADPATQ